MGDKRWTSLKILVVPKIVDSRQFQNFSRYHWERSITNFTGILTKSMNMRERRPAQWSPWWDYRDPPVTAMMRLHIAADDHQAEIAEAHQWPPWRYAEERRWPPAMRHGELHCSLHDSARGPGEKSPSIENKRALDGDEEDSALRILFCTDNGQIQHSF